MKTKTEIMNTLIKIQGELKAPKNQFNGFGKYKYRSCEDILEAVKPLCVAENALLTISDKIVEIGGYIFVEATARFMHGEFTESVTAQARHAETKKGMDDSQITGSASSYARKYALNGLFLIDDTKDADTQEPPKELTSKEAVKLAEKCTTEEALTKVWKANKHLHNDNAFHSVVKDMNIKFKAK